MSFATFIFSPLPSVNTKRPAAHVSARFSSCVELGCIFSFLSLARHSGIATEHAAGENGSPEEVFELTGELAMMRNRIVYRNALSSAEVDVGSRHSCEQ